MSSRIILYLSIIILIFCRSAHSFEGVYTLIVQKQEQKASSRWTLVDWLTTKKKMALMDQWLALNSSAQVFEMYIGGGEEHTDIWKDSSPVKNERLGHNANLAFYIYFFGMEFRWEEVTSYYSQNEYWLNFRLLGTSAQATNLTLQFGRRDLKDQSWGNYGQLFYGAELSIYLLPFFGVNGSWRYYIEDDAHDNAYKLDGQKLVYGAFLEIFFLRPYINLFKENLYFKSSLSTEKEVRQGVEMGARIYF